MFIFPPHWHDTAGWNPSPCNAKAYPDFIVNIMPADVLATQGARTSAAMILLWCMVQASDFLPLLGGPCVSVSQLISLCIYWKVYFLLSLLVCHVYIKSLGQWNLICKLTNVLLLHGLVQRLVREFVNYLCGKEKGCIAYLDSRIFLPG